VPIKPADVQNSDGTQTMLIDDIIDRRRKVRSHSTVRPAVQPASPQHPPVALPGCFERAFAPRHLHVQDANTSVEAKITSVFNPHSATTVGFVSVKPLNVDKIIIRSDAATR
jgi:hypothetical protein